MPYLCKEMSKANPLIANSKLTDESKETYLPQVASLQIAQRKLIWCRLHVQGLYKQNSVSIGCKLRDCRKKIHSFKSNCKLSRNSPNLAGKCPKQSVEHYDPIPRREMLKANAQIVNSKSRNCTKKIHLLSITS